MRSTPRIVRLDQYGELLILNGGVARWLLICEPHWHGSSAGIFWRSPMARGFWLAQRPMPDPFDRDHQRELTVLDSPSRLHATSYDGWHRNSEAVLGSK